MNMNQLRVLAKDISTSLQAFSGNSAAGLSVQISAHHCRRIQATLPSNSSNSSQGVEQRYNLKTFVSHLLQEWRMKMNLPLQDPVDYVMLYTEMISQSLTTPEAYRQCIQILCQAALQQLDLEQSMFDHDTINGCKQSFILLVQTLAALLGQEDQHDELIDSCLDVLSGLFTIIIFLDHESQRVEPSSLSEHLTLNIGISLAALIELSPSIRLASSAVSYMLLNRSASIARYLSIIESSHNPFLQANDVTNNTNQTNQWVPPVVHSLFLQREQSISSVSVANESIAVENGQLPSGVKSKLLASPRVIGYLLDAQRGDPSLLLSSFLFSAAFTQLLEPKQVEALSMRGDLDIEEDKFELDVIRLLKGIKELVQVSSSSMHEDDEKVIEKADQQSTSVIGVLVSISFAYVSNRCEPARRNEAFKRYFQTIDWLELSSEYTVELSRALFKLISGLYQCNHVSSEKSCVNCNLSGILSATESRDKLSYMNILSAIKRYDDWPMLQTSIYCSFRAFVSHESRPQILDWLHNMIRKDTQCGVTYCIAMLLSLWIDDEAASINFTAAEKSIDVASAFEDLVKTIQDVLPIISLSQQNAIAARITYLSNICSLSLSTSKHPTTITPPRDNFTPKSAANSNIDLTNANIVDQDVVIPIISPDDSILMATKIDSGIVANDANGIDDQLRFIVSKYFDELNIIENSILDNLVFPTAEEFGSSAIQSAVKTHRVTQEFLSSWQSTLASNCNSRRLEDNRDEIMMAMVSQIVSVLAIHKEESIRALVSHVMDRTNCDILIIADDGGGQSSPSKLSYSKIHRSQSQSKLTEKANGSTQSMFTITSDLEQWWSSNSLARVQHYPRDDHLPRLLIDATATRIDAVFRSFIDSRFRNLLGAKKIVDSCGLTIAVLHQFSTLIEFKGKNLTLKLRDNAKECIDIIRSYGHFLSPTIVREVLHWHLACILKIEKMSNEGIESRKKSEGNPTSINVLPSHRQALLDRHAVYTLSCIELISVVGQGQHKTWDIFLSSLFDNELTSNLIRLTCKAESHESMVIQFLLLTLADRGIILNLRGIELGHIISNRLLSSSQLCSILGLFSKARKGIKDQLFRFNERTINLDERWSNFLSYFDADFAAKFRIDLPLSVCWPKCCRRDSKDFTNKEFLVLGSPIVRIKFSSTKGKAYGALREGIDVKCRIDTDTISKAYDKYYFGVVPSFRVLLEALQLHDWSTMPDHNCIIAIDRITQAGLVLQKIVLLLRELYLPCEFVNRRFELIEAILLSSNFGDKISNQESNEAMTSLIFRSTVASIMSAENLLQSYCLTLEELNLLCQNSHTKLDSDERIGSKAIANIDVFPFFRLLSSALQVVQDGILTRVDSVVDNGKRKYISAVYSATVRVKMLLEIPSHLWLLSESEEPQTNSPKLSPLTATSSDSRRIILEACSYLRAILTKCLAMAECGIEMNTFPGIHQVLAIGLLGIAEMMASKLILQEHSTIHGIDMSPGLDDIKTLWNSMEYDDTTRLCIAAVEQVLYQFGKLLPVPDWMYRTAGLANYLENAIFTLQGLTTVSTSSFRDGASFLVQLCSRSDLSSLGGELPVELNLQELGNALSTYNSSLETSCGVSKDGNGLNSQSRPDVQSKVILPANVDHVSELRTNNQEKPIEPVNGSEIETSSKSHSEQRIATLVTPEERTDVYADAISQLSSPAVTRNSSGSQHSIPFHDVDELTRTNSARFEPGSESATKSSIRRTSEKFKILAQSDDIRPTKRSVLQIESETIAEEQRSSTDTVDSKSRARRKVGAPSVLASLSVPTAAFAVERGIKSRSPKYPPPISTSLSSVSSPPATSESSVPNRGFSTLTHAQDTRKFISNAIVFSDTKVAKKSLKATPTGIQSAPKSAKKQKTGTAVNTNQDVWDDTSAFEKRFGDKFGGF